MPYRSFLQATWAHACHPKCIKASSFCSGVRSSVTSRAWARLTKLHSSLRCVSPPLDSLWALFPSLPWGAKDRGSGGTLVRLTVLKLCFPSFSRDFYVTVKLIDESYPIHRRPTLLYAADACTGLSLNDYCEYYACSSASSTETTSECDSILIGRESFLLLCCWLEYQGNRMRADRRVPLR